MQDELVLIQPVVSCFFWHHLRLHFLLFITILLLILLLYYVHHIGIDLVQLHGNESPEYIDSINVPCIKVLHVTIPSKKDNKHIVSIAGNDSSTTTTINTDADSSSNMNSIVERLNIDVEKYTKKAILLLLDSRLPGNNNGSSSNGGGTGKTFDWNIINQLKDNIPCILAGGLTPENIKLAITTSSNVIGVDVSSGIEIIKQPGRKDYIAMKKFISVARE